MVKIQMYIIKCRESIYIQLLTRVTFIVDVNLTTEMNNFNIPKISFPKESRIWLRMTNYSQ